MGNGDIGSEKSGGWHGAKGFGEVLGGDVEFGVVDGDAAGLEGGVLENW